MFLTPVEQFDEGLLNIIQQIGVDTSVELCFIVRLPFVIFGRGKVDAQAKAWQETERKLSEKVNEAENKPYKQIASNVNSIKVAVITCICTLLVSGIIGAIVMFGK